MDPAKEESEFQHLYHRMLRPLTLFPRREPLPEPQRPPPQDPVLPLPVSRLTPASLCQQVAKRLAQSGLTLPVSSEARSHLTNVILDELKCGWWEPPPEPGLSHLDNQRLRKRLQAHVLLSSEQLFLGHLSMLATSGTASTVFTKNAMLVRLAASLARYCTQFLTGPDVYRVLLADFRAQLQLEQAQGSVHKVRSAASGGALRLYTIPSPRSTGIASVPLSQLSLNHLIKLSRPTPKELKEEPEQDPLKELMSIPRLKKRKSLRFWPFLPKSRPTSRFLKTSLQPQASPTGVTLPRDPIPSLPLTKLLVQKAESMPCLREGKRLADILGLPPFPSRPLSPSDLVAKSKPDLAAGRVAEDLKQLVKNLKLGRPCSSPVHSGLDPLLGALTQRQVRASRLKGLQETQKELEEVTLASAPSVLPAPAAPRDQSQPVTFTMKVNQGFVQGAAVLVSERSLESTYCVERAGLLYNHLSGELEPRLLDKMKVERFLGTSIREVYKELMSCVSSNYFSLDQESLGEEPALQTKPSALLTSAFLFPKKQYAAINPRLAGIASYTAEPLRFSEDKMASFSSFQGLQSWGGYFQKLSWLSWWRATVCTDDYFKYLYQEDTDFLHVIFHLYQEEVPKEALPPPVKITPKIQHPPPLLQDEEPDFVPGEWHWGSLTEYSERMQQLLLDESPKFLGLQERLEQLWSMLEVPAQEQLDMAIKYSSNTHVRQLPSLVKAWEQALEHIRQRELLLGKLEWFERQASNPNRFFQKNRRARRLLEENQVRGKLYRALRRTERPLTTILEDIEALFGEPVTFKGRSYLEKMKHDRVEMLFWLQQRRRLRQLFRAQKAKRRSQGSPELTTPRNTPGTS